MKKIKIGIFTGYFLPHLGGVERYVDKLSKALTKIGYDVVVVTSNNGSQASVEYIGKIKVYRLPIYGIFNERYPIPNPNKQYRELMRNIEEELIDVFIVNTRFHLTSLVGARLGRRQNKPVFLIEHGTDHFTVNNKILDLFGVLYEHIITYIIKRYVNKYYGVSKNCNKWLKHYHINAEGVFYNAISSNDKNGVKDYYKKKYSDDKLVITYAGRLIKEKGILNLLKAFEQLQKETGYTNIKMVVAGNGDLYDSINSKYNNEQIDILGKLDFEHVMALYKRTDIFVYPSLYPEGLPTSILEAGLMECAVIATPRGGTEEVIPNDSYGIIVDGSVDSLVIALKILIEDEKTRKRIAKAISNRVKTQFDWDVVARDVEQQINKPGIN